MKFNKRTEIKSVRRQQLIEATLKVIDQVGLADTTIMLIAKEAQLSTGIISHYFGDKNGLLVAVMQHIMEDLSHHAKQLRHELINTQNDTPKAQLRIIIDVNLSDRQTHHTIVKTWLAFWAYSMHQPSLGRLNTINERRLYTNLHYHFSRQLSKEKARTAAMGLSAMIEGLWLHRALSGNEFDLQIARSLAYEYLDHLLS